ncbi:hypothetical protein BJ508DRAFT_331093 [Ascobolus immersus RN42]|uniref:Uncharacterized protein n=1 Tax=Ascobolus immersus RN42 TaxID=1160509 RepID=A0A3N4HX50_ASCIM|nr:hypothetical protein BJ508DRAFT_331093 [Ascobolus immersus RN42]
MANGGVSADIVLFLKDSFRNRFSHLRAALLDEIVEAISKRADGMFRYAAILAEHHDELLYEGLPLSVEQHFQRFPERLAGWYQFILQELEERTLELRRRIFISIAVAARPLTVREVQGICVTDLYHGADTVHDVCKPESLVLPTPAEILAACGGLVEFKSADTAPLDIETGGCAADYFDEEEDYVVVYNQQATVQFINPSVREFLLMPPLVLGSRSGEPSSKVSSCMFGLEAGHRFLASICAVHLRSPRIGDSLSSNKIYCANHGGVDRHGDPISIDPVLIAVFWDSYFCGYALQHWSTHLQSSGVGIIGQDDTILSMQEDTSPEGSSKENAQIFLSRIDSPDDCVCRIDADFVLESYSILFWDKKFIRSRVSFFTMLSKYLYPRPGSSAEYSSLLSKYWTSFFHNSDAEDQFQDNLRSALDQFFFADCVDDRRQLNAINYFNGRYPNRKARLELANVTAYGCCWAQTELVWLYLSVKCFEKDCLLRRSLQYGVDFNSTVQTVGFPTYHLYLWQQHDKNLILPGLFIMRLILDDHTGTQQLCYLEMFLSSKCLDINNKGFYFSSTGPSAKVSGTLLHFLCECMVFHKFHQGGGAFGNDAKIQRNQARRCDSARNLRAMLEMVLERCTDLQINAVNSHGYSALGILLGSSVDRDDFYGGHNNPDLWCYAEEPRRIVAMLEKCGGKAIYPSGRSLFVNKATLLQDVDIAPEFPAGAKNGRWHGEQQFNMGQTVPLTINQNQWRHLSSNGTNVVPKTKSKHPQSDTEGVHKDRLLICGSSEPGSVAAEVSDFREITGDPKPPHNLEDHITGIPATTEAALEATHVAPKNGTARAVTEHQTL